MGAAELGHGVVAVAEEDPLVELLGALALFAVVAPARRGKALGELVEKEPPQRAGVARVAREQRALDGLGQVDQREDRPVEVGEMRREARSLGVAKVSDGYRTGR